MNKPDDHALELDRKFHREEILVLDAKAREIRMSDLQTLLNAHLESMKSQCTTNIFSSGCDKAIIEALRRKGHDLWSWGYDGGHTEVWRPDYIQPQKSSSLRVVFHHDWTVSCSWT